MVTRLADRLDAARHRRFVGRVAELALFRSIVTAGDSPVALLYVFGPGGVGKTALLHEFIRLCEQAAVPAAYLDGRSIQPVPKAFMTALQSALGLSADEPPLALLASRPGRFVLLIDSYEALAPLDDWFRDIFLPELPGDVLVVVASAEPPADAWQADVGWESLLRILPLGNLSPDESQTFLSQHPIPSERHPAILSFTHGHPLALVLVADLYAQRSDSVGDFQPTDAPDVIRALLEHLVQRVPSPAHRTALEACAMVRVMTEPLLAAMLTTPDAHDLFDWLRGLSFIESRHGGLSPHDLVRETLAADLHWRNPDWYAELHHRARSYYSGHLQRTDDRMRQQTLLDLAYLHQDNPVVRRFFEWQTGDHLLATPMVQADLPAMLAMTRRNEGQESARLAASWLACQPDGARVFRDPEGQSVGFMHTVALQRASDQERVADPATSAAWDYLANHCPLRPGEAAAIVRFWMADDTYQAISPVQNLIFIHMVDYHLTTSGLAFTFIPCAKPEFWAPICAYAGLTRLPEADFEVDGRRYGVYGHDWRAVPPADWLQLLTERETADGRSPTDIPSPDSLASLEVLSEAEFASAVHDALRNLPRPDLLHGNPLLRSRLVVQRVGRGAGERERTGALHELLRQAAEMLQATPRLMKGYRALYHTYFQPAPTQERAAELLDLPYSTFRRHLKTGVDQVTAILWQQEVNGFQEANGVEN
jgi:hypothetical protein